MIHYYYGDGKGKTTAALGLAVRALGSGRPVWILAFLKDQSSHEYRVWETAEGVTVLTDPDPVKFWWEMTDTEKARYQAKTHSVWQRMQEEVRGKTGLLILDEIGDAAACGLLAEEEIFAFLASLPAGMEVVLTGHGSWPSLSEKADYVTKMEAQKHPYQKGCGARKGIEY
jgi:cob(I)alamin adenosyltransferase